MQTLRNYFTPWSSDVRLDGKTVVITGANTGIGKETAIDLAKRGMRVIIACRDMEKADEATKEIAEVSGNQNVVCKKLDLADSNSIREFAQNINSEEKQLNILINNAGVMACPYGKTADGFEMQIGVNHMGHFLLTFLLIDLLKRSAPARIVTVSSMAHKWGTINLDDINSTGVTTYVLHPGVVQTELWRHMNRPQQAAIWLIKPFTKTSVQGAQTTIYCAVAPELETKSGNYYSDCAPANCSSAAMDDDVAQRLWDLSCQMLRITWD
ncbi:retinol dehydrogenase 12, like isoform X3 [Ictalurus punctatus]|uniref:Retinol dehydrogenase 12, like isoform X3 n=1 Tax=Ictalurus punctatus TaxID=7998 RepID=A0A979EZ06_ICTPU|nr:retinol dehydrogenase 12, like isoform X3 [Ictalurus punctatus]